MTALAPTRTEYAARDARNTALLVAEQERSRAMHEADVEYAETVAKLREQFEFDLTTALRHRIAAVKPAQRAYNAAVIAAETAYARTVAAL